MDLDEKRLILEDILNIMLVIKNARPGYLLQLKGVQKGDIKKRLKDIKTSFPNIVVTPIVRNEEEKPYEFLITKENIDLPVSITEKFLQKQLGYMCKYNEENAVSFHLNIPIFGYTCSTKDIEKREKI